MVNHSAEQCVVAYFLCGQLIERLPPLTRARILMALLGLVLLGLMIILGIKLGGRYVRRLSRAGLTPTKSVDDRWHQRPLSPRADSRDDTPI
jgi:hypothetical protein